MEGLRTRTWIAIVGIITAVAFVVPNFVDISRLGWWPAAKLNYGLDIQGGLHLVMGVDVDGVVATSVVRQTQSLKAEFAKENIIVNDFKTTRAKEGKFSVGVNSIEDAKKIETFIQKSYATSLQVISTSSTEVELKYFDANMLEQKTECYSSGD